MKENTRRKALEQQYEQAAFALLLDDLMAEEGAALLRETDGAASADVPPEADGRCIKTIRRADAKVRHGQVLRFAGKAVSRVAVVFLVVAIAFSVPFCTVSAFRAASMNYVVSVFDKGMNFSLYEQPVPKPYSGGGGPTWFPDGTWTLIQSTRDKTTHVLRYENEKGTRVSYTEVKSYGSGITVDSEEAAITTEAVINGWSAVVAVKDDQIIVVWLDEDNGLFCTLVIDGKTSDINEESAVLIAESVK